MAKSRVTGGNREALGKQWIVYYLCSLLCLTLLTPLADSLNYDPERKTDLSFDLDEGGRSEKGDQWGELDREAVTSIKRVVRDAQNPGIEKPAVEEEMISTDVMETDGNEMMERKFSMLNLPSLETALLSLAFLTFAVFLIDLVQDLLRGNTTTGGRVSTNNRFRRSLNGTDDNGGFINEDAMTDLIVLALSSVDTVRYGKENPDCGKKLLCHLNRAGWHDAGFLGTASNYFVSLILSFVSPSSGFHDNLEAAEFGRDQQECSDKYSGCPSILGDLLNTP